MTASIQHEFFTERAAATLPPRAEVRDAAESLMDLLRSRGLPARIVPAARAQDLRAEILGRHDGSEFDEQFYQECLTELSFDPPPDFQNVRSIIVAAVPRPETEAVFHVDGVARRLPIPPTYTAYRAVSASWLSWLGAILRDSGYHVAPTSLPLKLLATRSGLSFYGRNNISYVPGLGSYYELVSAYTDIPCGNGEWSSPRMLDRCLTCRACVKRCPTSAIRLDPFLLQTDRCLVFHNEKAAGVPFPSWIDPSAHHTVVGCLECQWICPENRHCKGWVGESEEFSEEETAMLMAGTDRRNLPDETIGKLERLDILRMLALLPRNLGAALR